MQSGWVLLTILKQYTKAGGTELAVAKMFKHLHSLGSEKHGIAAMAAKLRAAADLIGTLPDPITEASAVPDKKEGE